ncbi:MAG TPA: ABC transporter permease [Dermatophilaceae bacterium]|jgi:ABC-2 type transport system permease protein
MMRLTKVELRRLLSRRLTAVAVLGALVITGLLLFGSYQTAKPLSGPELRQQRTQFDQARKDWVANGDQQRRDCLASLPEAQRTDPKAADSCNQMEPKWASWGKPVAKFAEMMPEILRSGSYLLAFVGFLVGAGFVAAEFSSGSMANWLTFEPRRLRVYASKLGAAGLGMLAPAVALLGLLTAGAWLIVGHFASTAGTTAKFWGDLAQMGGRALALAVAAALAGAAMGVLFRHTAAVLGIAVGYLILVEGVFGQALQGSAPWLLKLNFNAWLEHGTTYYINSCKTDGLGNYACEGVEKVLTFGHSSAYLGILVVFLIALAALVFRRRDVS